jgi:hypothetical protein
VKKQFIDDGGTVLFKALQGWDKRGDNIVKNPCSKLVVVLLKRGGHASGIPTRDVLHQASNLAFNKRAFKGIESYSTTVKDGVIWMLSESTETVGSYWLIAFSRGREKKKSFLGLPYRLELKTSKSLPALGIHIPSAPGLKQTVITEVDGRVHTKKMLGFYLVSPSGALSVKSSKFLPGQKLNQWAESVAHGVLTAGCSYTLDKNEILDVLGDCGGAHDGIAAYCLVSHSLFMETRDLRRKDWSMSEWMENCLNGERMLIALTSDGEGFVNHSELVAFCCSHDTLQPRCVEEEERVCLGFLRKLASLCATEAEAKRLAAEKYSEYSKRVHILTPKHKISLVEPPRAPTGESGQKSKGTCQRNSSHASLTTTRSAHHRCRRRRRHSHTTISTTRFARRRICRLLFGLPIFENVQVRLS